MNVKVPLRTSEPAPWPRLSVEAEKAVRELARTIHRPGSPIYPSWHPAYRAECVLMNVEAARARRAQPKKWWRFWS